MQIVVELGGIREYSELIASSQGGWHLSLLLPDEEDTGKHWIKG
jgi:hypothetical protein